MKDPTKSDFMVPAAHLARPLEQQARYYFRVPRVADRPAFRHALSEAGARQHSDLDLMDTMRSFIARHLAADEDAAQRERLLGIVDAHVSKIEGFRDQVSLGAFTYPAGHDREGEQDADAFLHAFQAAFMPSEEMKELELAVAEFCPRYRLQCADKAVFGQRRGLVAARLFLTGWNNVFRADNGDPVEFKAGRDGRVLESLLDHVPTAHLVELGARLDGMMEPGDTKRGN